MSMHTETHMNLEAAMDLADHASPAPWSASLALKAMRAEIERLRKAQEKAEPVEMSPEFTDSARGAIAWVLYHHQGGSSPVGQPLRFALGMGAHEPLSEDRIADAKHYAAWAGATTEQFHRAPAERVRVPDALLQMNDDLLLILGKPNFMCAPIAHLMKRAGVKELPPKAEAEQAHVILWMLQHYLKSGTEWCDAASEDLKRWRDMLPAAPEADHG